MSASTAASAAPFAAPRISSSDIPHYFIDLDLPASKRWSHIIAAYKMHWPQMVLAMWKEFEELHGEHFGQEEAAAEEEAAAPSTSSKKGAAKKKSKPRKPTAVEIAAAKAARHEEHVTFARGLASQLLVALRSNGLSVYAEELASVASESGIALHELVLLNLSYEAHGGCTTILTPLADGRMMMGRTLDWQQPLLKHLTIELSFMRHGKLLYRATTFAGFLGIFTGMKPQQYAIAVNYRCADDENGDDDEDEEDGNQDESMEDDGETTHDYSDTAASPEFSWPVGFLVRHTFESCSSYAEALDRLHRCALMSQVYFIICGPRSDEACIITRDPEASVQPICIKASGGEQEQKQDDDAEMKTSTDGKKQRSKKPSGIEKRNTTTAPATSHVGFSVASISSAAAASASIAPPAAALSSASASFTTSAIGASPSSSIPSSTFSPHRYLVQANMDHWLTLRKNDHQESMPRVKLVREAMKTVATTPDLVNEAAMWKLLAQDPIWDDETIYATVAIPAEDRYVTLIENPHPQAKAKKGTKGARAGRRKRR